MKIEFTELRVGILGICVLLFATDVSGMEREYDHGSWISGFLDSEQGVRNFRAFSENDRTSPLDAFFAVDIAADCVTIDPNIVLFVREGVDSAGFLNIGSFQARVDTRDIIEGAWTSSANRMGDKAIFVSLLMENPLQLIRDMKRGWTLRVKIEFIDDTESDVYLKYSLDGSSAAINRAFRLCKQLGNSDERYFE